MATSREQEGACVVSMHVHMYMQACLKIYQLRVYKWGPPRPTQWTRPSLHPTQYVLRQLRFSPIKEIASPAQSSSPGRVLATLRVRSGCIPFVWQYIVIHE